MVSYPHAHTLLDGIAKQE